MMIRSLLLVISGSIAAYKSLELIRLLKKQGIEVDVILTRGGAEFVTPLAVSSLSGNKCYTDLFSLTDEVEMGHIQLSRKHDMILVAPASADLLAKMAAGLCDDLATTALLATDKPVMVAPAMNVQMWEHAATQRNIKQLRKDGVHFVEPGSGELACGEVGAGRMAEPEQILEAVLGFNSAKLSPKALQGKKVLITAGPTHEPIDPVRFIGNHSSGKQGIAIAEILAYAGAEVTLVMGPTSLSMPQNVVIKPVTTAQQMFDAVQAAMPADIAICTAAVADWTPVQTSRRKLKKRESTEAPAISLKENPDILAWLSQPSKQRPELVIGFAAETDDVLENAQQKRRKKQCDWLVVNDVSDGKIFGSDDTMVALLKGEAKPLEWKGTKREIAVFLGHEILETVTHQKKRKKA